MGEQWQGEARKGSQSGLGLENNEEPGRILSRGQLRSEVFLVMYLGCQKMG